MRIPFLSPPAAPPRADLPDEGLDEPTIRQRLNHVAAERAKLAKERQAKVTPLLDRRARAQGFLRDVDDEIQREGFRYGDRLRELEAQESRLTQQLQAAPAEPTSDHDEVDAADPAKVKSLLNGFRADHTARLLTVPSDLTSEDACRRYDQELQVWASWRERAAHSLSANGRVPSPPPFAHRYPPERRRNLSSGLL